ncbi:MAG: MFS transporter [Alphaproteobacteria bacterium]|nr:MFS transporter [Alphaproteobacteria bacterium]
MTGPDADPGAPMVSPTPLLVWRLAAASTAGAMQFWLLIPLTTIALAGRGLDAAWIGLFAAGPWFALALFLPLAPWLARRIGALPMFNCGSALAAAAVGLLLVSADLAGWLIANLMIGAALACRWVAADALVAALAPPERRGRVMGIYGTMVGAALALAPAALALVGTEGAAPYWLAGAITLLCVVPLIGARAPRQVLAASDARSARVGMVATLLAAGAIVPASAALSGVLEAASAALMPVWGLARGFGPEGAAALVAAVGTGNIASQYPLGWLADRFGPRRVMLGALLLAGAALALLALAGVAAPAAGRLLLWPLLAAWGGAIGALYTLAILVLSARAAGGPLVAGVAAAAIAYTLGGLLGPPGAGLALSLLPAGAFPLVLAGVPLAAALAMAAAPRSRPGFAKEW